jgi:hypothetical protein
MDKRAGPVKRGEISLTGMEISPYKHSSVVAEYGGHVEIKTPHETEANHYAINYVKIRRYIPKFSTKRFKN